MNTNKIEAHNSVHNLYITDHEFAHLAVELTKQFETPVAIYLLPLSPLKIICVRSHGFVTDFNRVTTCVTEQCRSAVAQNQSGSSMPLYLGKKTDTQEHIKKDVAELNRKLRILLNEFANKHALTYGSVNVKGDGYSVSVGIEY